MGIETDITRLQTAKSDIATAIDGKGVAVPVGTKMDGFAALIDDIETGGDVTAYYMGDVHTISTAPAMPTITTSFTEDE